MFDFTEHGLNIARTESSLKLNKKKQIMHLRSETGIRNPGQF